MRTGVRSFQLNGTPVARGVVKRFESVITILCGSPFAFFTSRNPSAPAPPPLFTTTMPCFIRLFFATTDWMKRAIWSAPPPVPAGTMNSTVLVGSHAKRGGESRKGAGDHDGQQALRDSAGLHGQVSSLDGRYG